MTVLATHGELTAETIARLARLPLEAVVVSDSISPAVKTSLPLHVVSLDSLLAETISRLHTGRTLDEPVLQGV
jgi:phosphoribosylpyrophosphate synthetase